MSRETRAPRVVVTGMGLVTSVGHDVPTTWAALCAGASGIRRITQFDPSAYGVQIAGEVRDFDAARYIDCSAQRHYDRGVAYALAATQEALHQSGVNVPALAEEVGVIIGSGKGGVTSAHALYRVLFEQGPDQLPPWCFSLLSASSPASAVALLTGARGPCFATVSACATATNAIGEAFETIRRGDARVMIAGGVDENITPIGIAALTNMGALSRRNAEPTRASRPFDAQRDGFVMGAGAGILVLEALALAQARQAPILGEIVGYGATADAHHITEPVPAGKGIQRAMQRAVEKAAIELSAIDYINAHGTSTLLNDRTETAAIKALFGAHAYRIAVSSTKSMIGHTMGAAGAIEAVVTLLSLREGIITPTINLEQADPACDLDYVPNVARQAVLHYALSNSMGFGGHNACLAMRRWDEGNLAGEHPDPSPHIT
jgi:3-oxoacyl-[acyl-carrier-protein] synthase II